MTVQHPWVADEHSVHGPIKGYLGAWRLDPRQVRPFFIHLLNRLAGLNACLDFVVRQGVSASLRASAPAAVNPRPLFCIVDVVQDHQGPWLSVCFYADTVTDPEGLGSLVPKGLLGEDGQCFDIDRPDEVLEDYVLRRVQEAWQACS